jgi:hypothetical protein
MWGNEGRAYGVFGIPFFEKNISNNSSSGNFAQMRNRKE